MEAPDNPIVIGQEPETTKKTTEKPSEQAQNGGLVIADKDPVVVGVDSDPTTPSEGPPQKAGLLQVCEPMQFALNVGSGVQKYDLSEGYDPVEHRCPFGSLNVNGTIVFNCSTQGWQIGRHNCYHCEGVELTLELEQNGQVHEYEFDLEFGHYSDKYTKHCKDIKFKDGKVFPYGEVAFTCGTRREWELVRSTCSTRRCPDSWVYVKTDEKEETKAIIGKGEEGTLVDVNCPGGSGVMKFNCTENSNELDKSGGKLWFWQLFENGCQGDTKFPTVEGFCPGRTATINATNYWAPAQSSVKQVHINPGLEGTHMYPCPTGMGNDGTIEFDCRSDGIWSLRRMNCLGKADSDEMVGQARVTVDHEDK